MKQQLIGLSAMNRAPVMLVTLQIATEPRGRHTTEYLVMVILDGAYGKDGSATAYMFSVTVLAVENSRLSDDITDGQLRTKRDIPGNLNNNRRPLRGAMTQQIYIRRLAS